MIQKAIEIKNVYKKFKNANQVAVNNVSLNILQGEFITILGSSGSGKTTFLKMINKLYEPTHGLINLFGDDISQMNDVVLRRRIGYVIQQVGLFPHMTIAQNISIVLKLLKWSKEDIRLRVIELLELLDLNPDEMMDRYPCQLSGGQQQRVGLARALAADPEIMLMDEPLGAVDAITRLNLQEELLRIHRGMDKTFLLVTHDISEAFKLGDRVIIMNNGEVLQFDTPRNIMTNPTNDFVKTLIESSGIKANKWG